jgi:hypothetical protein
MRAMEENEAEVAETANEFEIFDNVISIISSAAALTDGLPFHQTAAVDAVKTITQKISKNIGFVPDQFELLNAISGLIWMYGEARVAFASEEQKENKAELAKHARQVKAIASGRIAQIITEHGLRHLSVAPMTQHTPPAIARAIIDRVKADLEKFGHEPIEVDAVTKRVRKMLRQWKTMRPPHKFGTAI